MESMLWPVIGVLAAVLTSTSFIPQLVVRLRNPRAARLSYGTLAVFMLGGSFWTVYGIHLHDPIIICANVFIFINLAAIGAVQWQQEKTEKAGGRK